LDPGSTDSTPLLAAMAKGILTKSANEKEVATTRQEPDGG